ncbi:phage adaptor protein [Methylobacterium sp. D48H]
MPTQDGRPTLADLYAEIADDIERADLGPQIATAVDRAIRFFQPDRFFFNEGYVTFQTVPGSDVYASGDATGIPDLMAIDSVVMLDGSTPTFLRRIDEAWIEAADQPESQSQPCAYSYFERSLRLWPMPSDAWTIRLMAHVRLPAPGPDEANAWTDEASSLIAAWAKRHLARNSLRNPVMARDQSEIIAEELSALQGRSNVIASTGQVQAYDL